MLKKRCVGECGDVGITYKHTEEPDEEKKLKERDEATNLRRRYYLALVYRSLANACE